MSSRPAPWPAFGIRSRDDVEQARQARLRVVQGGNVHVESPSLRVRVAALVVGAAIVLFGLVVFHVVLSQGQFRLEKLQTKAVASQGQYDRLRLQVAELESPEVITQTAQMRLGMIAPEKVVPVTPSPRDLPKGMEVTTSSSSSSASSSLRSPQPDALATWSAIKPDLATQVP